MQLTREGQDRRFPAMTKNNPLRISWGRWWSPWLKSVSRRAQRCTENKRPSKRELCSWPQKKVVRISLEKLGPKFLLVQFDVVRERAAPSSRSYLGRKHTWSSRRTTLPSWPKHIKFWSWHSSVLCPSYRRRVENSLTHPGLAVQ